MRNVYDKKQARMTAFIIKSNTDLKSLKKDIVYDNISVEFLPSDDDIELLFDILNVGGQLLISNSNKPESNKEDLIGDLTLAGLINIVINDNNISCSKPNYKVCYIHIKLCFSFFLF